MRIRVAFYLVLLLIVASFASAQATRTWVSGVGDDVNPCSRTAPCKTYAGAISKTAANGEISTLDPGGFGAITITKAITIDGGGEHGSILGSLVNGVTVNAGVNDAIILRNLSINGAGNGLTGVRYIAGKSVHIEGCTIFKFSQNGIRVEASTGQLEVVDTTIRNNADSGIRLQPTGATTTAKAMLNRVQLVSNTNFGLFVAEGTQATIRDSAVAHNGFAGIAVQQTGGTTVLNMENVVVFNNARGLINGPGASTTRISNTSFLNNATAGREDNSGGLAQVISFGNNRIAGNGTGFTINSTPGQL